PRKWSSFVLSSRRRHTRSKRDWSSDVCSSDLQTWRISAGYLVVYFVKKVSVHELESLYEPFFILLDHFNRLPLNVYIKKHPTYVWQGVSTRQNDRHVLFLSLNRSS